MSTTALSRCQHFLEKKKSPLTFKIHSDTVYFTVQLTSISTLHLLGQFPVHHVRVPHLFCVVYDYNWTSMVKMPSPPISAVPCATSYRWFQMERFCCGKK